MTPPFPGNDRPTHRFLELSSAFPHPAELHSTYRRTERLQIGQWLDSFQDQSLGDSAPYFFRAAGDRTELSVCGLLGQLLRYVRRGEKGYPAFCVPGSGPMSRHHRASSELDSPSQPVLEARVVEAQGSGCQGSLRCSGPPREEVGTGAPV